MRNMKVSAKLVLSFMLIVAMSAVIGVAGIVGLDNLSEVNTAMYEQQTTPLTRMSKIIELLQMMRVNMREYALGASLGSMVQIESAFNANVEYQKTMTEYLDAYYATMTDPSAIMLFEESRRLYDTAFKDTLQKTYELSMSGDIAGVTAALAETKPVIDKIVENFDQCMASKTDSASKAAADAAILARNTTLLLIAILAGSTIIAILLTVYISGMISKPLVGMSTFLEKIKTTGNMTITQKDSEVIEQCGKYHDEIGRCVGACASLVYRLLEINDKLGHVADGDLAVEMQMLSEQDSLGGALNKMVKSLNSMFGEINSSTEHVTLGANQVASGAQTLAQGSAEQASAAEELSASIGDVAAKTKENADMAARSAALAAQIRHSAEQGGRQMEQMMQAVKDINDASNAISKVIKVIDDIAFQTNILALNAAVEAARAGQHGKGFAVVAEEVRSLAAKSAEAAKDTSGLIANSMEKAKAGTHIADETAASLAEIVAGISESSQIAAEIAKLTEEQTKAIDQINIGIDQVAQVVQKNSATAQESAAASEEMSSQSNALRQLVARFKLADDTGRAKPGAPSKLVDFEPRTAPEPDEGEALALPAASGFGKY